MQSSNELLTPVRLWKSKQSWMFVMKLYTYWYALLLLSDAEMLAAEAELLLKLLACDGLIHC